MPHDAYELESEVLVQGEQRTIVHAHRAFDRRAESEILGLLDDEPIEDCVSHPAERILEQFWTDAQASDRDRVQSWVCKVLESAAAPAAKAGVLRLFSRLIPPPPEALRLQLAARALEDESLELREAGVRALESWGGRSGVDLLRSHREPSEWLARYIEQVIHDLTSSP